MKKYTFKQLNDLDRAKIEALLREGLNQADIARNLEVYPSTVSREIKNRGTPNGYFAQMAQANRKLKKKKSRRKRKIEETPIGDYVLQKIRAGWSPEAISGRLKREIKLKQRDPKEYVNHESIYQFVYNSDYGKNEKLYEYLRRGKKRRSRKFGRKSQKGSIPNRVFIDLRPKEAERRKTVGHWEGDTIHYPAKKGINSLVERKTRFVELTKIERRTAEETTNAVINALKNHYRQSLTVDNGSENVSHQAISQKLAMAIFFCHAYHSWEKGSCENMNGLVRKYLPKRTDLSEVNQEDLDDIADELNDRPRKILAYSTPRESLESEYKNLSINIAFSS